MNITFTPNGVRISRDTGEKRIYKETTVICHALRNLNAGNYTRHKWVRYNPSKHEGNLTSCTIGIRHNKTGEIYWHVNYQVETAHEA